MNSWRVPGGVWAAADSRVRGFLVGGTAGRTTLNGEGLHLNLFAWDHPFLRGSSWPVYSRNVKIPDFLEMGGSLTDLEQIYAYYALNEPVASLIGTGLQRYRYGGENVRFINALALLSGNIGRAGGGSYFQMHSYRNLNLKWLREQEKRPRRSFKFPLIGRQILEAENPPIEMLWVNGSNVINQAPDSHLIKKAFAKVDFKVVVDAFMTDTAQCADLVLPSMLIMEQEDIIGSYLHEQVQYVCPALAAPGEARNDYWILRQIGKRLDPAVELPSAEDCLRASLDSAYVSTTLEELRDCSYVRSNRSPIAYQDLHFDHQDGRYRFPYILHPEPQAPAEFPLRLLSLVRRKTIHSQILAEDQNQPPEVWVAPDSFCLKELNLARPVELISPLGRLQVSVQTMEGLHPEVVIYRRGDWISRGGRCQSADCSPLDRHRLRCRLLRPVRAVGEFQIMASGCSLLASG